MAGRSGKSGRQSPLELAIVERLFGAPLEAELAAAGESFERLRAMPVSAPACAFVVADLWSVQPEGDPEPAH